MFMIPFILQPCCNFFLISILNFSSSSLSRITCIKIINVHIFQFLVYGIHIINGINHMLLLMSEYTLYFT